MGPRELKLEGQFVESKEHEAGRRDLFHGQVQVVCCGVHYSQQTLTCFPFIITSKTKVNMNIVKDFAIQKNLRLI